MSQQPTVEQKKINWTGAIFLTATPIATIVLGIYFFKTEHFHVWMALLFLFFYAATAGSVTTGYHRLWAHKTYSAHPIVRWTLALFGAASFQNSILRWASDHRLHHRFVDENDDPYSISKGFWYAHFLWMYTHAPLHPLEKAYRRDLLKDNVVMFQDKHYVTLAIAMGFVLPMVIGWACGSVLGGLLFGALLRIVVVHHFTFFINSLAHCWGSQKYTDTNTARDNWLLALLTYGEGYHNFHHFFSNDYRNGIRWYHWDPTKWIIELLSLFGLAFDLKKTPDEQIFAARFAMEEKRASGVSNETLLKLKQQLEMTQLKFFTLKNEYREFKALKQDQYRHKVSQLRKDLKVAKSEFREAVSVWRSFLRSHRRLAA